MKTNISDSIQRVHDEKSKLIVRMYIDIDKNLAVDGLCFNLLPGVEVNDGTWDDEVMAYYFGADSLDLSAHHNIKLPSEDGDGYDFPYYEEYGCVVYTPDFDFSCDVTREELKAKYPMIRDLA